MADALKTRLLRPGAARTRLEAETYAETRPCPNCGKGVSLSSSQPTSPSVGGIWEVVVDCYHCGSILRYIFDPAPSWDPAGDRDPDPMAPRLGPKGTVTEVFAAEDLRAVVAAALPQLTRFETRLDAAPEPPALLQRQTGQWGLRALRALRELETIGQELTDEETGLKTRLESHESAARALAT